MASEVFALTDEQILEIEPEAPRTFDGTTDDVAEKPILRVNPKHPTAALSEPVSTPTTDVAQVGQPATTETPTAPQRLTERMNDPWVGEDARRFWESAQHAEREAAAFRQIFATPEDARAAKELRPVETPEVKLIAERARQLEDIDAAYFGQAGKPAEELTAARARLAEKLHEQDPAAFREMLTLGMKLVGSPGEAQTSQPQRSVASAVGASTQQLNSAQSDANIAVATSAYREFERSANAELEHTVGASITRILEDAMPNLKRSERSAHGSPQQGTPLRERLIVAVREDLESALKSDPQLGEQVAGILRGRRFDETSRQQVVRLIDSRAQQLVPGAVRRVVGTWTQSTLGNIRHSAGREEPAAPNRTTNTTANSQPKLATQKTSERAASAATHSPGNSSSPSVHPTRKNRGVDYHRLTDEQILEL